MTFPLRVLAAVGSRSPALRPLCWGVQPGYRNAGAAAAASRAGSVWGDCRRLGRQPASLWKPPTNRTGRRTCAARIQLRCRPPYGVSLRCPRLRGAGLTKALSRFVLSGLEGSKTPVLKNNPKAILVRGKEQLNELL